MQAIPHNERRKISKNRVSNKMSYPKYVDYILKFPPADTVPSKSRGGAKATFPFKVHGLLDYATKTGKEDIIHWLPHGRAFLVRDKDRFESELLPFFFSFKGSIPLSKDSSIFTGF